MPSVRYGHVRAIGLTFATAAVALAGCSEPTGPKTVASRNLAVKVPAIKDAVASKDMSAAPQMVSDLDSDDPAVRFYAIEGLERLTGQTMGYVYYEDRDARRAAVMKWRKWLDDQK